MSDEPAAETEPMFQSRGDFDAMWDSARRTSRAPDSDLTNEYYVHPVMTLYAGLFFGPIGSALTALAVVRGRIHLRWVMAIAGIAGSTWLLIQGATARWVQSWTGFELQFLRSGLNFAAGVACFMVVHFFARKSYAVGRLTWHRSLAAVIVLASAYWVLRNYLFAMGR